MRKWIVIQSPTDPEMCAVIESGKNGYITIADKLSAEDARKISAAPLMYEALEEIVNNAVKNYEGSMDICPEAIAAARAALQAAKGGGDVG